MEITQKVTPKSVRMVVVDSKGTVYSADITEEVLELVLEKHPDIVWKRPRGTSHATAVAQETDNGDT